MTGETPPLRFAVFHLGARRHYAVPAALARAGMLQRLYTDLCADVGPLRHLGPVWPRRLRPRAIERMLGRRLPAEVPPSLVRTVPLTLIRQEIACRLGLRRGLPDATAALGELARRERFGGASAIYTILDGDNELCREARMEGMWVVHDVIIPVDVDDILEEERRRFPGIEPSAPADRSAAYRERVREKCQIAHLVITSSPHAAASIRALGADPARIVQIPLALDARWVDARAQARPGRVLAVGTVGLRKGSPDLAAAARLLARRGVRCEIRMVGPYPPGLTDRPEFAGPTYVGQVPRSLVHDEFLHADLFVLPSLCDTCPLAHLEALASGLPVITTPNAGSVVRDGVEGFVVPIRDPEALAERIERIVTDRALRQRMSDNARARARELTWDRYGERLLAALATMRRSDK